MAKKAKKKRDILTIPCGVCSMALGIHGAAEPHDRGEECAGFKPKELRDEWAWNELQEAKRRKPKIVSAPAESIDRERIGVADSLHRRILELCERLGLVLIDARDLDHLSRRVLVFDDETHLTEITIEDLPKPEDAERIAARG